LVPSDRVIVPSALAWAAPPAATEPVVVTAGHAPEHAPEHIDASPVSFTHRYTARPDPLVRNVFPDAVAVVIVVLPDALPPVGVPVADGDPLAGGALLLELLPLLHAATRIAVAAAPASTAPTRVTGGSPCATLRSRPPARCMCPRCLSAPDVAVVGLLIYIVSLRHD
jgi:hypothetical protein